MFLASPDAPQAQEDEVTATTNERTEVERPGRTGLPIPRFVSLHSNEINLRKGPGTRYPIKWVYRRRGLPVEVIDEFTTWRRIRDWEGTVGWVHQSMLSGTRTLRVLPSDTGERRILLREQPSHTAEAVAELEPGVLGNLEDCEGTWCRAIFSGLEGWLPRTAFFGVYDNEKLD